MKCEVAHLVCFTSCAAKIATESRERELARKEKELTMKTNEIIGAMRV